MKTFTAALAVLFVAVLCYQVSSTPPSLNRYGPCCLEFLTKKLPLGLVKSYQHTGNHCPQPAVIFVTKKDKDVCARPDDKWVQDLMNQLKFEKHRE